MTETSEAVLYEVIDGVAVITFNRPDRLNAWNTAMHRGYYASLDRAVADSSVKVIVVTGAGRGFCAGADMESLQAIGNSNGQASDGNERSGPTYDATYPISLPKPVIAAINGACAGLGFVHAMAADIRFAAEGAKFTVAFSRRGLIGEHGLSWTLPRLVGQSVAADLMLSGRVFMSDEAEQLGLVKQVCPQDQLMDTVMAYAQDLAANVSPTSMAVMKHQIYNHPSLPIDQVMVESNRLMHESLRREDFKEGVASFVEKRPPSFAPYTGGAI